MKKILGLFLIPLLFACTPKNTMTINGTTDVNFEGKNVVLFDVASNQPIDTAVVASGVFTFEVNTDLYKVLNLRAENKMATVFVEPGIITATIGAKTMVSGNELTDAYKVFLDSRMELSSALTKKREELKAKHADNTEAYNEEYGKYYTEVYQPQSKDLVSKIFEANKTNALGLFIYSQTGEGTTIDKIDEFIAINPSAKEYYPIKNSREILVNQANTAVGKMFTDIIARDINDTKEAKLSDYVGKGKFVLVDFWASWCGPCKAELPYIKEVYKKYGKKNLIVLGVNVWDKHPDALKSIEDYDMNWDHIYASFDRVATTTYGVRGIPTLILFGPDGTIVDRTFRGQNMVDKMAEYLK